MVRKSDERVPFVGDLQVQQDLSWADFEWRVERVGQVTVALLLLLAALGAFGSGLLATTQAGADGLSVEYPRVLRLRSPETWQLAVPTAGSDATTGVLLSTPRASVTISDIHPQPRVARETDEGTLYVFDTAGTSGEVRVWIDYEAEQPGVIRSEFSSGDAIVKVAQFVFP